MKRIIVNPFTPIPKSEKSHVRGWAMIWAQRLNADIATKETDISRYDEIYIEHGVNFSGNLNLFGGLNDEVAERLMQLLDCANDFIPIYSLDYNMVEIDYHSQMLKRLGSKSTSDKLNEFILKDMDSMFLDSQTLTMNDLSLDKLIIGDSHSVAYSKPDQIIARHNGKTLHGAMANDWLLNQIMPYVPGIKEITICLGSIDIRFHLLNEKTKTDAHVIVEKYAEYIDNLETLTNIKFKVCAPVPIEHEERRLPKTGQYDGQNFFGSRQERLDYTLEFIHNLENQGLTIVSPPEEWYAMDGEKYAKEIMEANGSVHIAPKNYNSVIGWKEYEYL